MGWHFFDRKPWIRFESHDRPLVSRVMTHIKGRGAIKEFGAGHHFLELRGEAPSQRAHNSVIERTAGHFLCAYLGINQKAVTRFLGGIKMPAQKFMDVLEHDRFIAGQLNGKIARE